MVDTRNEDLVKKYFDLVQEEIKKLISQDKEIKPNQIETFNNEIFNQSDEIRNQIKVFVDKATMNNLDINKVAKIIYDKFKLQVKNNVFNQDDVNDVPNPMLGERKHVKTFENFLFEFQDDVKLKWSKEDFSKLITQLKEKLAEARKFLGYSKTDNVSDIDKLLSELKEIELTEAEELIYDIIMLIDMIKTFTSERRREISKLN
jgi:hypothetical protein